MRTAGPSAPASPELGCPSLRLVATSRSLHARLCQRTNSGSPIPKLHPALPTAAAAAAPASSTAAPTAGTPTASTSTTAAAPTATAAAAAAAAATTATAAAAAGATTLSGAVRRITVAAMSLPASVSVSADGAVTCLPAVLWAAARHIGRRLQAIAAPERGHGRRECANRWHRSWRRPRRRGRRGGGGRRCRCRRLARRLSCKLDGLCHIGDGVLVIAFVGIDGSPIVVGGNILRVEFNGFAKVGDRLIVFFLRRVGDPAVAIGRRQILFWLVATLDNSRTRFQFAIGILTGAVLPIVRGRRYRPCGERQTSCEEHHLAHRSSPWRLADETR